MDSLLDRQELKPQLTDKEVLVLRYLAGAWNEYNRLTVLHGEDISEFLRAIHTAENLVLARVAVRMGEDQRPELSQPL